MFKIRNSQKQPDFYAPLLQENGGFQVPPTEQLYDCRPSIVEIKKATGRTTIRGNLTYLPSRPAIYGKYRKENTGNLTQKPVAVVRNSFLPSRKSANLPNNNINRTTDEQRKALRLEDIERNGNLVQVADKTLNRVFDKFDLFTISDKLIDLEKKGKLERKDVRASAILKLVKEVKSALRSNSLEEVREALDKVKKHKAGIIPDISDLGSDSDEVAQNPALILALMNEVYDEEDTEEYTMLLLAEMLRDGDIYINPDNSMINDLIHLRAIAKLSVEDIEDGLDSIRDVDTRILLASILNKAKQKEMGVDEDTDNEEEEKYADVDLPPTMPITMPPRTPAELPKDILEEEFEPELPAELPKDILEEEFEPEQIYDVVEYGSNEKIQKQIQDYINKTRNEIVRMLAKLPRQLDPSFEDKIKMNKKRMFDIAKDLLAVDSFESKQIKEYVQGLINDLNKQKAKFQAELNLLKAPKEQEMLDDEPLIEEIEEEVKEENNPFADEETLKNVLENIRGIGNLWELARKLNKYVGRGNKYAIKKIQSYRTKDFDELANKIYNNYLDFNQEQERPTRRMLSFDKALEEKLRQCALQNVKNAPQRAIINRYKIPQLNDNNIVNVVEDMCNKAGFTDDKKQLTMKCAIRGFITKLRADNIIDDAKARELRNTVVRVEQKKQTAKNKLTSFKRVFNLLASQSKVERGGPSVRPQPRGEPQIGEPSRPMTISDLPQPMTIEQIQRMR
jgi:hypothetical protein